MLILTFLGIFFINLHDLVAFKDGKIGKTLQKSFYREYNRCCIDSKYLLIEIEIWFNFDYKINFYFISEPFRRKGYSKHSPGQECNFRINAYHQNSKWKEREFHWWFWNDLHVWPSCGSDNRQVSISLHCSQ